MGKGLECHICGKEAAMEAVIEGSKVPVCAKCSQYGRIVSMPVAPVLKKHAPVPQPSSFSREKVLVSGFGRIISGKRERLGLSREQLAKKIFVREHELGKMEEEKLKPDEKTGKKIEYALGIKLYEEVGIGEFGGGTGRAKKSTGQGIELADAIELKKE